MNKKPVNKQPFINGKPADHLDETGKYYVVRSPKINAIFKNMVNKCLRDIRQGKLDFQGKD